MSLLGASAADLPLVSDAFFFPTHRNLSSSSLLAGHPLAVGERRKLSPAGFRAELELSDFEHFKTQMHRNLWPASREA